MVSEETIMLTGNQPLPRLVRTPWNKGRLIGQKRPLKPKDVWAIRVRLQLEQRKRDLAPCSISPSTVSCGAVISCGYESMMCALVARYGTALR